jgi:rod shape determining protein RodA
MAGSPDSSKSVLKSIDWVTILIYVALLVFGWFSICGACYDYESPNLFSLSTRSGMQVIWIGTSFFLALVLLLTDDRLFETFAYLIYAAVVVLLLVTIFIAPDTKGSRSWLKFGAFSIQPAEFAKFATALALAKLMGTYEFTLNHRRDIMRAMGLVLLPMLLIIGQRETGSALVYLAFFLMFYREGMPGSILFIGIAAVVYFVVGVRFDPVHLWKTPTSVGEFSVLLLIVLFTAGMVKTYGRKGRYVNHILLYGLGTTALAVCFSFFVIPIDITWIQLGIVVLLIGYLCYIAIKERFVRYFYIAIFALGSVSFFYSADFVLNDVLEPHQQVRIKVLLGLEDDPTGAGYNVNQSKIAIGSGGLQGKGFLNGTQTKLKYVPEQETDFIFCTVGEEEGFFGTASVLVLFLALILRLIHLSERQVTPFGRVYGYSVMSIFLFHVFINVGMVLGLTPVIGIPLPFFSYGGSSLWGFTLLLFIFLRIDAGRNRTMR